MKLSCKTILIRLLIVSTLVSGTSASLVQTAPAWREAIWRAGGLPAQALLPVPKPLSRLEFIQAIGRAVRGS